MNHGVTMTSGFYKSIEIYEDFSRYLIHKFVYLMIQLLSAPSYFQACILELPNSIPLSPCLGEN